VIAKYLSRQTIQTKKQEKRKENMRKLSCLKNNFFPQLTSKICKGKYVVGIIENM
jgi:hypothetical protein